MNSVLVTSFTLTSAFFLIRSQRCLIVTKMRKSFFFIETSIQSFTVTSTDTSETRPSTPPFFIHTFLIFNELQVSVCFMFHARQLNMVALQSLQHMTFSFSIVLAFALVTVKATEALGDRSESAYQTIATPKPGRKSHKHPRLTSTATQMASPSPRSFSISKRNGPVVFKANSTQDEQLESLRTNAKYFIVQQFPPRRRMRILLRVDVYAVPVFKLKNNLVRKKSLKDGSLLKSSLRISRNCYRSMCAARLTVVSSKSIRWRIIRKALQTLRRSHGFSNVYSLDPRRYRIKREGGRKYIVFVPFKNFQSEEF